VNTSAAVTPPLIPFDNTYARLPNTFFRHQLPVPVASPTLLRLNAPLATALGLPTDGLAGEDGIQMFAGNRVPRGAEPIAMAYAGHQFANWVPQLGDGRAVLLGEFVGADGIRRDVQLKGSGITPFSRGGDGRAALGPVLREYIVSEAMAGLGIPTTRALAMVRTGEDVLRQWGPEPGGVLTRIAQSHVRVGTFQYFLGRGEQDALRTLTSYVIDRHYPALKEADNPALALLEQVSRRTAELIARWQLVGFIHGVMNTDNTSVVGETIDFGPCAFVDDFHPDKVFSSIDRRGRYAWSQQPMIGAWNIGRLADTLLAQMGEHESAAVEMARDVLARYAEHFALAFERGWRSKLGLRDARDGDRELVAGLLDTMAEQHADFTRTFRALCEVSARAQETAGGEARFRAEFDDPAAVDPWLESYRARLAAEPQPDAQRYAAMRLVNPKFIARNHQVQRIIDAAYRNESLSLLDDLLTVLANPFDEHPDHETLSVAPAPQEVVTQTFCGT
jgi:uncharacterized protein YdiU (UPF0061 family)